MTSVTTSLGEANSAREEWRRFAAFLKRPALPARARPRSGASLRAVLRMLGLDFAMMAVLMALATAVVAAGVDLPETALETIDISFLIVALVVIGAPLLEEIAFRGWLSGRPGHVFGLLALVAGLGALAAMPALGDTTGVATGIVIIACLVFFPGLALLILWRLRRRDAMGWFTRAFPLFFWLSTAAFACVHLFNFDRGSLYVLLPLVLPQFVTGSILGYLRVHYGLWAAMLLHALHNGTAIALVLAGTLLAG
ncbi:CPBP family glutamic-type intramembrane protease [Qipengyuania sp. SM2507]